MSHDHDHDHDARADRRRRRAAGRRARARARGAARREGRRHARGRARSGSTGSSRARRPTARASSRAPGSIRSFKERLLADARAAALELGLDPGPSPVVVALENTDDVHHMVVCTLCSCYPKALLGPPPDWYKSLPYRSRAVSDPRGVLARVRRSSSTTTSRCASSTRPRTSATSSIPRRPAGTRGAGRGRARRARHARLDDRRRAAACARLSTSLAGSRGSAAPPRGGTTRD